MTRSKHADKILNNPSPAELELAKIGFFLCDSEDVVIDEIKKGTIYTYSRNQSVNTVIHNGNICLFYPDKQNCKPDYEIIVNTFENTVRFFSYTDTFLLWDFEIQALNKRLKELNVI